MNEGNLKLPSIQAAEKKLLLQTYERNPDLFVGGNGVYLSDEQGQRLSRSAERHRCFCAWLRSSRGRGDHRGAEQAAAAHFEPLLPRAHRESGAAADGDQRARSRLLLQLRHRSLGGCAEACARPRRDAALRGEDHRHQVPGDGTQLSRTNHGLGCDHAQGEVSRAIRAGYARRRICSLQRCRRSAREVFVRGLRHLHRGNSGRRRHPPVSQEFFAAARELCDSTGALLLADEIQSGMGRTGKWFAYQHYGILPDVTTLAKPIANGLPMGAMLCTERAAGAFLPGHARHDLRRWPAGLRGCDRGDRHDETGRVADDHPWKSAATSSSSSKGFATVMIA